MPHPIVTKEIARRLKFKREGKVNHLLHRVLQQAVNASRYIYKFTAAYTVVLAVQYSEDREGPYDWDTAEWFIKGNKVNPNENNNCKGLWNGTVFIRTVTVYKTVATNSRPVAIARMQYLFDE
ncbi:hypothetical protein T484DRAFT_1756064 [Baffinella frigidus]|nr:hypothetical protein T484DRAFT_1756064 [Cryptophyta sp. CCMP2293]